MARGLAHTTQVTETSAPATFCYRFGSAEFDEARCELRVAGLRVDVEPRALAVLAYLLRHAGEVVTKEELLTEVWAGRVTVDKVLPNAVNKLRRALGEANAGHILTQARVGYRLEGVVTRTAVGRQPASPLALAAGSAVPQRPSFILQRPLGVTGGSEVWLAGHAKTQELRVYKFALGGERLRALKREATLLRLLHDSVPEPAPFVELLDWNFEHLPYFLECRHGGANLQDWAAEHLAGLGPPARLALVLQIADALAAAHAAGVLHKDLKPANVLVNGPAQQPQVRLTDFGSGQLLEPDRLAQLGITRLGMTVVEQGSAGSTSGTPLYIAPELFAGQSPTARSDVYALGILMYQVLAGRLGQPMASGWEAGIDDELLREDLRLATDGNPERRLSGAAELAQRLRQLDQRRHQALQLRQHEAAAQRDREAVARARARRPFVVALVAVLGLGVVVALWLQQQAVQARNEARAELQRASALARFLNDDLIGQANPVFSAKGADLTLREALLAARGRVPARFAGEPATEAAIHGHLAALFSTVDLFAEAEAEARLAINLLARPGSGALAAALPARAVLVRVLSRTGRLDEAKRQLAELEQDAARAPGGPAATQRAMARGALLLAQGDHVGAAAALRAAVQGHQPADPGGQALHDMLRLDLVSTLELAGHDDEAREEGRRLVQEAQARGSDGELLVALARLAMVRAQGEDHDAAETLLLQARPVIVARLGENHSRHVTLLGELLGVAFRRADWPKAADYARLVHERARAKFGDEHASTWVTLLNWARVHNEAGQPRQALERARTAHRELLQRLGPQSPKTQDAGFVLALVELQLGHTDAALALLQQLDADVLEAGRGLGYWPRALDALRGIALQQRGDAGAARPLLDAWLAAMAQEEEALAQPSRLHLQVKAARAALR